MAVVGGTTGIAMVVLIRGVFVREVFGYKGPAVTNPTGARQQDKKEVRMSNVMLELNAIQCSCIFRYSSYLTLMHCYITCTA